MSALMTQANISQKSLPREVQLYAHPDAADFVNEVMLGHNETPTSFLGKVGKGYDDITGNMKSLLLAWSPIPANRHGAGTSS